MGFYILGHELLCSISHFITEAARGGISNIWAGRWEGVAEGGLSYGRYYGMGNSEHGLEISKNRQRGG